MIETIVLDLGSLERLTVITENVKHLEPFIPAVRWQDFEIVE